MRYGDGTPAAAVVDWMRGSERNSGADSERVSPEARDSGLLVDATEKPQQLRQPEQQVRWGLQLLQVLSLDDERHVTRGDCLDDHVSPPSCDR